jgi:hypothetical protein
LLSVAFVLLSPLSPTLKKSLPVFVMFLPVLPSLLPELSPLSPASLTTSLQKEQHQQAKEQTEQQTFEFSGYHLQSLRGSLQIPFGQLFCGTCTAC